MSPFEWGIVLNTFLPVHAIRFSIFTPDNRYGLLCKWHPYMSEGGDILAKKSYLDISANKHWNTFKRTCYRRDRSFKQAAI